MKMPSAAGGRAVALGWFMAATAALAQQPPPQPPAPPAAQNTAADYARPPELSGVALSPSGRRAAMIVRDRGDGRLALAVLDLPPEKPPRIVASYGDADVTRAFWVTEDRLAYNAYQPGNDQRVDGLGGTFAVNHDGSDRTELISMSWRSGAATGSRVANRTLNLQWQPIGPAPGGSGNDIFVREIEQASGEWRPGRMARLDTVSGASQMLLSGAPPRAHSWVFDAAGEPRVVRTTGDGRDRLHRREGDSERWTVISDLPLNDPGAIEPLWLEAGDQLIVATRAGQDASGLYIYDLAKRTLDPEPLAATARYDIDTVEVDPQLRRVVATRLEVGLPQTVWFTEKLAALQQTIDAALPGRANRILCNRCETSAFYVVSSSSDQHPGEYFLYDPAVRRLQPLGPSRPWIDPARQGRRTLHWTQARDGLALPVVVTHPPGSSPTEPLPTVVLVHGGPWVHGASTVWEPEAQFLATRGWRVLQPQFRGTTGLGMRHFTASFRQWGQAMQDDLADAVRWAVDQRLVDAGRVCIYGGSYGGYAALMGPIRHPAVYRCAASFAGVTDIMLMFSSNRSDITRDWKRYGMPQMVGDPVADLAMLKANSPIRRVAELKVPVLLGHGNLDQRVPDEHADDFQRAASKAGVAIERIDYPSEGHGFAEARNLADFWSRLDRFLARSLNER